MKRIVCCLMAFFLSAFLIIEQPIAVHAADEIKKEQAPRSIGIVFDNSGSMYSGKRAWCRAIYAMEVFGTMLNDGDTLSIYPMHPVTIDGAEYTMDHPVRINGSDEAESIRKMYTPDAKGTPIETIDAAYQDLSQKSGEKWLIVLTDGDSFYENKIDLGKKRTVSKLNERLSRYNQDMNILYLGIGKDASMPSFSGNDTYHFFADKASETEEVLSKLTAMCNRIFGRDLLPENHFDGKNLDFDVSLGKLIVFVQGENVANVSVKDGTGKTVGTKISERKTHYSEKGAGGDYASGLKKARVDEKLQGVVVTYADCPQGHYSLDYTGTPSNIAVYYEPDVDLIFTFTYEDGQPINPNELYEGTYTVSYGMMDGREKTYTNSDLLGNTEYKGSCYINGEEIAFECTEKSGKTSVHLDMDDKFNAKIKAEYLNGYTIEKSSKDFGWPEGGLTVAPRPAGSLELKISGGDEVYHLSSLEEGKPFVAEVYYQGEKLTGEALEATEISWDPEASSAYLEKAFRGDYYDIVLSHKNPGEPTATPTGQVTFPMTAYYTPQGSETTASPSVNFSYTIDDPQPVLSLDLYAENTYYQISKLEKGAPIRADLKINDALLTDEQLDRVVVTVRCSGLQVRAEKLPGESAYLLYPEKTEGLKKGEYEIFCESEIADSIGRVFKDEEAVQIHLTTYPMWVYWSGSLLLLLIIAFIIWRICRIRRVPKHLRENKKRSTIRFDDEDITKNAGIDARLNGETLRVTSTIAGKKCGLQMNAKAADDSYLYMNSIRRKIKIDGDSVKTHGSATISEATIGTTKYVLNEETHRLERVPKSAKPFVLKNDAMVMYSGEMMSNGENKSFSVITRLNYKK